MSDPPAGRGGVQHWERSAGSDPAPEDYGVLWEEGEADRTAEENVSATSSNLSHLMAKSWKFPVSSKSVTQTSVSCCKAVSDHLNIYEIIWLWIICP